MAINFKPKTNHQSQTTSHCSYVDQPAPSFFLLIIIGIVLILGLLGVPWGFYLVGKISLVGSIFIISCAFFALFYTSLTLLALGTTKYSLDKTGIDIRFGIWHRFFVWQEIKGFYQQKGFFANKVNLPGATPCVRLSNAVVLKLATGKLIFLTPKDSFKMLEKIAGFIPPANVLERA